MNSSPKKNERNKFNVCISDLDKFNLAYRLFDLRFEPISGSDQDTQKIVPCIKSGWKWHKNNNFAIFFKVQSKSLIHFLDQRSQTFGPLDPFVKEIYHFWAMAVHKLFSRGVQNFPGGGAVWQKHTIFLKKT